MNRWQKIAWFNLIVVIAGFVLSFVAAATLPAEQRFMPPNRLTVVIIATLAAVAAAKLIFRKKAKPPISFLKLFNLHHFFECFLS